jgi:hypothetical protein
VDVGTILTQMLARPSVSAAPPPNPTLDTRLSDEEVGAALSHLLAGRHISVVPSPEAKRSDQELDTALSHLLARRQLAVAAPPDVVKRTDRMLLGVLLAFGVLGVVACVTIAALVMSARH